MRWRILIFVPAVLGGAVVAQDALRSSSVSAAQDMFAPVLSDWIQQARDDAVVRGTQEIPQEFRAAFDGFVAAEILDRVRWRVDGDTGLPGQILFQSGSVRAVTLDNVILFANIEEAANIKLWAHELCHVIQYERWGIDEFAQRYINDQSALEHEAREFRWDWMKATDRVPAVSGN